MALLIFDALHHSTKTGPSALKSFGL